MTLELISILIGPMTTIMVFAMLIVLLRPFVKRGLFRSDVSVKQDVNSPNDENAVPDERRYPGYFFIDVPEEQKNQYFDMFVGFDDFARMRGYDVSISIETSVPHRLGFKITILDTGVTVSTGQVKKDIAEYANYVREDRDFDELPVVTSTHEHEQNLNSLKARMSLLKHQLKLKSIEAETYENLVRSLSAMQTNGVGYSAQPLLQTFAFDTRGSSTMTNDRIATNSPAAVLGDGSSATVENSPINIGSTVVEQAETVRELGELIDITDASSLSAEAKKDATRYLANAKEEIEGGEADKGRVENWMGRAKGVLDLAEKGSELAEKTADLFSKMGIGG